MRSNNAMPSAPQCLLRLSLLALLVGLLGSCAYRARFRLPEAYETYGVEIFANSSLEPDLERQIHGYLTRTLSDTAGARVVSPGNSDVFVRGTIQTSERRPGIRNRDNEWLESGSRIIVRAELVEAKSGRTLSTSQVWVEAGFVFGVQGGQAEARDRALENAAQRLILELLQQVDAEGPQLPETELDPASERAPESGPTGR
ncbi:MAG: hypothetical protein KDB61_15435 [Planctomycetes bacterium]|nr:hypothetical protein [Planctomycetota bacterium]